MKPGSSLHPLGWWLWAIGVGAAALQTTNLALLLLLAAEAAYIGAVFVQGRSSREMMSAIGRLAVFVIVIRLVVQILFGQRLPGTEAFALPSIPLPSWAAGVSIGGPVTWQSLEGALESGIQLAVVLECFSLANALAHPYRLLRVLPAVLYETGLVVSVALAFTPELVQRLTDVKEARRLRGRPTRGLSGVRHMAVPVLEGGLQRSLELAAAMDARGFGRAPVKDVRTARRRTTVLGLSLAMLILGSMAIGGLGVGRGIGLVMLALGGGGVAMVFRDGERHSQRTRYRPDRFGLAEWLVSLSGVTAGIGFLLAAHFEGGTHPLLGALALPPLPLLALGACLVALLPVVLLRRGPEVRRGLESEAMAR